MGLSTFTTSASAMNAQAHSLSQIGTNVANTNTVGYKKSQTLFSTMLAGSAGSNFDSFGTQGVDRRNVALQGLMVSTGNGNDLGIDGNGFFIVNSEMDGSGQQYYTRAGSFAEKAIVNEDGTTASYLTTQDGVYYIMGYEIAENGTMSSELGAIRTNSTDQIPGTATTEISVAANIPAETEDVERISLAVYDNEFNGRIMTMSMTNQMLNDWTLDFTVDGGTIASPASNTQAMRYNGRGELIEPLQPFDVQIDWDDGTSSTIAIDLEPMTQLADKMRIDNVDQNGKGPGMMVGTYFDERGMLNAKYSNADLREISRIAVAQFPAENGLELKSGSLFTESAQSGPPEVVTIGDDGPYPRFMVQSLENSNVELSDEFTRMITTQKAYSSAAQVFKTGDEMIQEMYSLKR